MVRIPYRFNSGEGKHKWYFFYVIQLNVFLSVLCCSLRFSRKTMFDSSLLVFVFVGYGFYFQFVFIYIYLFSTWFPYQTMFVPFNSNTTCAINGQKAAYPSRAPALVLRLVEFVLLALYFSLSYFIDHCLSLYPFDVDHCIVRPSICDLWLHLWYLQIFLLSALLWHDWHAGLWQVWMWL